MSLNGHSNAFFVKANGIPVLPNVVTSWADGRGYNCPNLIYCIWKSGRHAIMRLTCKSWTCGRCSIDKINEMTQFLADATVDQDTLYEVATDDRLTQENISRYMRKKKISCLNIKLTDGFFVIASDEAVGKDWQTNTIPRIDAILKVHSVNRLKIRRRDFTLTWKPESTYEPKRDTVVLSKKFDTLDSARYELAELGQDIDSDLIVGDPLDLVERMVKTSNDLNINFEVQDE